MQSSENGSPFVQTIFPACPLPILTGQPEAQCQFYQLKTLPLTEETSCEGVVLQLNEQYIVQVGPDHKQILSVLECDYEVEFEVVRRQAQAPNKLGEAEALTFLLKDHDNRMIRLSIRPEHRKSLERFALVLGRKYIVQKGFHNAFKAYKKIGKGMTACVYNALNFGTGREVAIKSFKRSVYFKQDNGNGKQSFLNEFRIMTRLNHPNLVKMLSVYESQNSTYVILQLYASSLYGHLSRKGFPSITQARGMMIALLNAMAYIHSQGIMHRDLKLQNIMVKYQGDRVVPVIIDFGLAEYTSRSKFMYVRCGTPGYVAPQVLKIKSTDEVQTYSEACDVFSLGVIFYILVFRKPLFEGNDPREVIRKNARCEIDFGGEPFTQVDAQLRDLFVRMLEPDPTKRLSARQALQHPFLLEGMAEQ